MVCRGGTITVEDERDVLILDGECGLCHGLAEFIDKRIVDTSALAFRPGDSEEGRMLISKLPRRQREADTVYLIRNGKSFVRSAAAIRCLLYMGIQWRLLFPLAWMVPLPLRDIAYLIVARYRHYFFERPTQCTFRID